MDSYSIKFEQLFTEHNNAIFRHLYYRLGSRERAIELTQEVFMNTWQHIRSGKPIEFEKAFLYRIANNLFINEIRTNKQTYSLDELQDTAGFEPKETRASPVQYSQEQELLRFLEYLQPTYRDVLVLRYIDGLAVQDIANVLKEKETNISMRIQRALAKLKDIYESKK